jgi:hypothetical protein
VSRGGLRIAFPTRSRMMSPATYASPRPDARPSGRDRRCCLQMSAVCFCRFFVPNPICAPNFCNGIPAARGAAGVGQRALCATQRGTGQMHPVVTLTIIAGAGGGRMNPQVLCPFRSRFKHSATLDTKIGRSRCKHVSTLASKQLSLRVNALTGSGATESQGRSWNVPPVIIRTLSAFFVLVSISASGS